MDAAERFLAALLQAVAQSAPYVVIGYLVAACIREWVPMSTVARLLAPRGARPLLAATGIGAVLPLCSCTVIPVGVGLVRAGAARGTVLSFLVSAPALSPVSIMLAITLMGGSFAGLYVAVCVLGALLLGLVGNRLLRRPPMADDAAPPAEAPAPARPAGARIRSAARWAFWDLGTEVSVDLVVGLAIAAAILALLPMGWIAAWLGGSHTATLLYVILIGIPMYTCSVPSMPVVQSLLLAGMSPGAGIAYLIAGPTTNLGELLVLRRAFGGRTVALFAGGLVTMALAGGIIANQLVFSGYAYRPPVAAGAVANGCCVSSFMPTSNRPLGLAETAALVPAWHWPFVAALAATVSVGLARRARRRFGSSPSVPGPLAEAMP